MPATLIRLGYGEPTSGVYPDHVDLVHPAWQLRGGTGYVLQGGRREHKAPVNGDTLVIPLGKLARTHNIDLVYRPRLEDPALPVWDQRLEDIDELGNQVVGFFWGDRFRGRCIITAYTWNLKDAGYVQDTNVVHGGFFAREIDVNLKLTRLLEG